MSPDKIDNSPLRHQPADEGRNCRNSDPALALTPLAEGRAPMTDLVRFGSVLLQAPNPPMTGLPGCLTYTPN